jgi:hypothetical protein
MTRPARPSRAGRVEEEGCHQVEANMPGRGTGGISRTIGREKA